MSLAADGMDCGAPGCQRMAFLNQDFGLGSLPSDWETLDASNGSGEIWNFTDPGGRGNLTGGSGGFASLDSNYYSQKLLEASLRTDQVNLSGDRFGTFVEFDMDLYSVGDAEADVEVSVDDGLSWTTVWHQGHGNVRHFHEGVDISAAAAGSANVRVRF